MKKIWMFLVLSTLTLASFAEYRFWRDIRGNEIEAEFTGVKGRKIVLRNRDGKEYKLSPSVLCAADQEFLKDKIPDLLLVSSEAKKKNGVESSLRLDIKCTKNENTKASGSFDHYRDTELVCKVAISKKSRADYSGKLKASLYVIGKSDLKNAYVLLDRKEHDFDFSSSREISFSGSRFTMRQYIYASNRGTEYVGYVVIVTNEAGETVEVRSSSGKFEEYLGKLTEFKKGQYFNRKFEKQTGNSSSKIYYY